MGEGSVLGVVIAVVGMVGSVLVARISSPRARVVGPPVEEDETAGPLAVSPEIWTQLNSKITTLEGEVAAVRREATEAAVLYSSRVSLLEGLLRQAMRIIRRTNRRLTGAGLPPEEVPADLIPYSID
ncbi:hypothetical protein [Streptomyces sp. NPDC050504]|uniref:hypothetical protein n=1 Tax=Streptomyces sp. NPDC050504 TaxID=3365618 RepID=UPI0037AA3DD4